MEIFFDKAHPKNLLEALNLIQDLDFIEKHTIAFYDSAVNDAKLKNPILFRIDRQKRGMEPVTDILFENGFRVFALKLPSDVNWTFYDLSVAIIGIWPTAIELLKVKKNPFICKSNAKFEKLIIVRE